MITMQLESEKLEVKDTQKLPLVVENPDQRESGPQINHKVQEYPGYNFVGLIYGRDGEWPNGGTALHHATKETLKILLSYFFHIEEFHGPEFLEVVVPQLVSKKVRLPPKNLTKPYKLELAIYSSLQGDEVRGLLERSCNSFFPDDTVGGICIGPLEQLRGNCADEVVYDDTCLLVKTNKLNGVVRFTSL
ncbi:hypothetical protein VNO77_27412 [Canavalia gladiata]|uniref:Uncharacterized protein n=1 Tax=Canavalia gladiata TaxID=3824 RepID=A0AAN9KTZ4_CANGL